MLIQAYEKEDLKIRHQTKNTLPSRKIGQLPQKKFFFFES
jgi:hypothetical protein